MNYLQSKCLGEWPLLSIAQRSNQLPPKMQEGKNLFFFFKLLSCSFVDLAHGVSCQGIFALKPSKCFNTVFSSMLQTFLKFRMVSV